MHLWPIPRRSSVVFVAIAVLVTVATACSSDSKSSTPSQPARPAAVVGGTKVAVADLMADLKAEATAAKKNKTQPNPSSPLATPEVAKKPGTYTPEATAAALTNRILYQLYDQQLRSHKTKVAATDKERAHQSLCQDPTTGAVPAGTSCPPLGAYPAAYRNFQIALQERALAFGRVLYGRIFGTVQRTKPAALKEVCLDLVQVDSQAVSDQIVKAMNGGASLADASKSDAAAGKASPVQPGCLYIAGAPADLAKAKVGGVVPIKSQSAFGVAKVTSFKSATKDQFAIQPPQNDTTVQKLIKSEVDSSISRTKVTVLAKYGRWSPSQRVVVAPKSKTTTTTTAPASTTTTKPSSTTSSSTTTSSTAP